MVIVVVSMPTPSRWDPPKIAIGFVKAILAHIPKRLNMPASNILPGFSVGSGIFGIALPLLGRDL